MTYFYRIADLYLNDVLDNKKNFQVFSKVLVNLGVTDTKEAADTLIKAASGGRGGVTAAKRLLQRLVSDTNRCGQCGCTCGTFDNC